MKSGYANEHRIALSDASISAVLQTKKQLKFVSVSIMLVYNFEHEKGFSTLSYICLPGGPGYSNHILS